MIKKIKIKLKSCTEKHYIWQGDKHNQSILRSPDYITKCITLINIKFRLNIHVNNFSKATDRIKIHSEEKCNERKVGKYSTQKNSQKRKTTLKYIRNNRIY